MSVEPLKPPTPAPADIISAYPQQNYDRQQTMYPQQVNYDRQPTMYPQQVNYGRQQTMYVGQPMPQQVVIVQQQSGGQQLPGGLQIYPQNVRQWETGLCACFDDMESCLCGMCFPCICLQMCKIGHSLNESCECCLGFCGICCLSCIRTKTRVMMGVTGSVCDDCCCSCCCGHLVLCQVARQLKAARLR